MGLAHRKVCWTISAWLRGQGWSTNPEIPWTIVKICPVLPLTSECVLHRFLVLPDGQAKMYSPGKVHRICH
jgi:hypothetical protein